MNIPMKAGLMWLALLCCLAPSVARADRTYYLVGEYHVFLIGKDKYAHYPERQKIEEQYADAVAADQAHYDYQVAHGANQHTQASALESALHDLATERDRRLEGIYELADYERCRHPELQVKAEGPYQVMGVDVHTHHYVEVLDDLAVYPPWPGYTCVGPVPYGWSYGAVYTPTVFVDAYWGWNTLWVGWGCPAFVGLYGFGGPVAVLGIGIGPHGGFSYGAGIGRGMIGDRAYAEYQRGAYGHVIGDPPATRGGFVRNAAAAGAGRYGAMTARSGGRPAMARSGSREGGRRGVAASGARRALAYHSSAAHGGSVATRRAGAGHGGYVHNAVAARGRAGEAGAGRGHPGGYVHHSVAGRSGSGRSGSSRHGYSSARSSGVARSSSRGRPGGFAHSSASGHSFGGSVGGGHSFGGGGRGAVSHGGGGAGGGGRGRRGG